MKPAKRPAILMICLGNICRSPVAEGIMRQLINQYNLNLEVDSAGLASYHIGENPDPRSIKNAKQNGTDISQLVARKFEYLDFELFDHIYVMDHDNYKMITRLSDKPEHINKISFLMDAVYPGNNTPVPDPYYEAPETFQKVYDMIFRACNEIIKSYQQG